MTPGETFSKTWRLINAGSCTWSPDYSIVFFSGDLMGAARTNNLGLTVTPGKSVDITLDMTAPPDAGNYQGNWILSDSSGELFGIGPDGDAPFWVRIDVTAVDTSTPTVSPTSTLTPTPGVYTTGLSNLIPGDSIDLDKNQVNDGENDDVRYTSDAEDDHQLIPENGTTIAAFGMTKPTYQDCASATLVADPIKLDSIDQGTYFCFSTHIGLPGWMRLVALNPQDHTLTIEILTWVIP
jgi:hypothetical protein